MSLNSFSVIFVVFILLQVLLRFYLASRQIRHVDAHKAAVPSEFAERISLASHQKAAHYTIDRNRLILVDIVFDAILLLGLTLLGGLTWINSQISQMITDPVWYQVVLVLSVIALISVLSAPLSWYRTFVLEEKYGFNRMTLRLYLLDTLKGTVLGLLIGIPILWAFFWFTHHYYNPHWWFWAWVAYIALSLLLMFIVPKFIMPLFNKFTPLDNADVQERVTRLAERTQFGLNGLFVMDSSKRTGHGNAFFVGFGKNRRIVFFDNLLHKLNPAEIEAVLAHELGHFKHKHILKRMLLNFIFSLAFFALLGFLINQTWFYAGLGVFPGIDKPSFAVALILLSLVLPVITFLTTPLSSYFSRRDEFQADQYSKQQSNAQDLISALVKLYDDNAATLTPDPLHSSFYDSHPPASIRIARLKMFEA